MSGTVANLEVGRIVRQRVVPYHRREPQVDGWMDPAEHGKLGSEPERSQRHGRVHGNLHALRTAEQSHGRIREFFERLANGW